MELLRVEDKIPFFQYKRVSGISSVGWIELKDDEIHVIPDKIDLESLGLLPGNQPYILKWGNTLRLHGTVNIEEAGSLLTRHSGTTAQDIKIIVKDIEKINESLIPIVVNTPDLISRMQGVYRTTKGWEFANLDNYELAVSAFPLKIETKHTNRGNTISLIASGETLIKENINVRDFIPADEALGLAMKMELIDLFSSIKDGEIPLVIRDRNQVSLYKFGILDSEFKRLQDINMAYWHTLSTLKDFCVISVRKNDVYVGYTVNGESVGEGLTINRNSDCLVSDIVSALPSMGLDLLYSSNDKNHNLNRIYSSQEEKYIADKVNEIYKYREDVIEK